MSWISSEVREHRGIPESHFDSNWGSGSPRPNPAPLSPGTSVDSVEGIKVREPWKLLWLFSSPAAHFVFGFAAMYFCKDGSCHLNLCTDTVAQLKKKTVSEQICFYMDLIRNLPGAQFWAWCCQDIEDLWDTAFDFRGCQHAIECWYINLSESKSPAEIVKPCLEILIL